MPDDVATSTRDQANLSGATSATTELHQRKDLIDAIIKEYAATVPSSKPAERKLILGGRDLDRYRAWLVKAHAYFRDASERDLTLSLASEWMLDNFYIIQQAGQQIEQDLPRGYYRQLPKLAGGALGGYPRIYAIVRAVLYTQSFALNVIDLQTILLEVQDTVALTMGELWAVPIFLRYSLIEALAHTLVGIIHPQVAPEIPPYLRQFSGISEPFAGASMAADDVQSSGIVANIILSLRSITEQDWNDYFESVSKLEQTLRKDPAGIYSLMDFGTRNVYRTRIERLALATGLDEQRIAEQALTLAGDAKAQTGRTGTHEENLFEEALEHPAFHVGEYLIGKEKRLLEDKIGYKSDTWTGIKRWVLHHSRPLYLTAIIFLSLVFLSLILLEVRVPVEFSSSTAIRWILTVLLGLAVLVPILTASSSLINWLITLLMKPSFLPKMKFRDAIPDPFETLIVIPALIGSREDVDSLIRQMEMHFLHNPEPGLLFGLLTDYPDADSESLPEDEGLVQYAQAAVEKLNFKYRRAIPSSHSNLDDTTVEVFEVESIQNDEQIPASLVEDVRIFYLFHRKRVWNAAEGKWMGWERKRGKLHELDGLLRGAEDLSFQAVAGGAGNFDVLKNVHFVITLDADTVLPHGAARRLVGTLAHPVNHARFADENGRVVEGYTILQPRMEIHPRSTNFSLFTRIFAGDTGLDLYTRAVSNAYQDLFGEGSYVGKGIYDVDAFERSVNHHIPDNSVLSHDLLEGIMGRAGLVTDITLVEDYPSNYFVHIKRQQRWIRGDWQLLPWLFTPGKFGVRFSTIDRWKMFDNLIRSLLSPALVVIFILGIIGMPSKAWFWLTILGLSLGIPLLTSLIGGVIQTTGGKNPGAAFHASKWDFFRWLLAIAFLPYEAYNAADAIFTALYRLFISHRYLLQWTTAAQSAKLLGLETHRNEVWLKMSVSSIMAVILGAGIQLVYGLTGNGMAPSLKYAIPILVVWMVSPWIAQRIDRQIVHKRIPLGDEEADLFRRVARRTWGFFERFVGPEDHWLPPDHFQESPVGIIAHQTSPSNIGLLLTSTLAAFDFGYLDQLGLSTRLTTTLETLDQLERFRGHFLNWYDTLTLKPLIPRYISTVDSGNLAASLVVIAQACKAMPNALIFRWDLWRGYLDTLSTLGEVLEGMGKGEVAGQVREITNRIGRMHDRILAVRTEPAQWYDLFQEAKGSFWIDVSQRLGELVSAGSSALTLDALRELEEVAAQVNRNHQAIQRTLDELVPWIGLLEGTPQLLKQGEIAETVNTLRNNLPYNPLLGRIGNLAMSAMSQTGELRRRLNGNPYSLETDVKSGEPVIDQALVREAQDWVERIDTALAQAAFNAESLVSNYATLATQAERFVDEMDFQFLYNPQRRVFHNGYNLDAGMLDNNHYDLLASEARIASIIALAKGDVPHSHWLQLGRPLTRVEGEYVLLSWSATMFEYLLSPLFLRAFPNTLLDNSAHVVVTHQINYGRSKGVPWGISEAGFYRFDPNQNYQYRAFGVPGLGFKRGLADDLVVAPYASLLAIRYDAPAVARNLTNLIARNCYGLYGLYESIDFTSSRLPPGVKSEIVKEYMAHHQGMIMMALVNYFQNDIMVRRMHSDPRIQSVELLLQEQIPQAPPVQNPFAGEVKGFQRIATSSTQIAPWNVPVQSAIPQANLLSNGDYSVLISNMGSGYSTWRDIDLTRWQADPALDSWGTWIYIQQLEHSRNGKISYGRLWSAGHQPIPGDASNVQVTYFPHMAVYRRSEENIFSTMEVTVASDDPVEIRRVHLHNAGNKPVNLRLTSYGEVILTQQAGDTRHPAFNKLFIDSEFVPQYNLQIFTRRLRSNDEKPVYLGHMLVVESLEGTNPHQLNIRYEADRRQFIGRGGSTRAPAALTNDAYLSGTSGATLDPIFSLGHELDLHPHASAEVAYLTFAADSREGILAMAARYSLWPLIERTYHHADLAMQAWMGKKGVTSQLLEDTMQILSAMLYPFKLVRAAPEIISANRLGQSGLWRFGISGDYPIILVEIEDAKHVDLVREILQVQDFMRSRRFSVDVVILNRQRTEYGAELNGILHRTVSRMNLEQMLNQRGGIFILYADQINADEAVLLQTAAKYILKGEKGSLHDQMPPYPYQVHHLPEFSFTRPSEGTIPAYEEGTLPKLEELQFFNGYGGFNLDGHEYVIDLPAGKHTPAPWVNIIGYPKFGFMVSESGSQTTWSINSGENRLTPWSNDPVTDPTGEVLYFRDEENGEVWSATPLPAGDGLPYRVRHGAGYTIFEHHSHGLTQQLTLFASPEDPVKIIHVKVHNDLDRPRRVTATQYVEWVLGTTRASTAPYIIPEYDTSHACLLATNPYNAEFGQRTAFLTASKSLHGLTADRAEFLGRAGNWAHPAALQRIGLETRLTPGEDPCAALQIHLDLLPGASEEFYFVLGEGSNKEDALNLAGKYHDPSNVGAALQRTHAFWDHLLGTLQVHTPQPETDILLNRWTLYQALSCRIWGRSAFYQPSGAFGFRDQLQDVLSVLHVDPAIARGQILNAAQRQFTEGDVLHWWHPPLSRGVRTRISDDLLWLPYVTAIYVETTGDADILEEKIPYLDAPPLNDDELERYNDYSHTNATFTLLDHCLRAIEKGATSGVHGLPLIGTGDWNDGLNRVGVEGRGESVWMGWFLCDVLERFAAISEKHGDASTASRYRSKAKEYSEAIERSAWDGGWYRRAYFDDGTPIGSELDLECQIDAIAQSWSVLSGAGQANRSRQAMQSVLERLVQPENRLSLLFAPPFDKSARDPGYIKGYFPGIRENGGQYTHAAIWTTWAFARLGEGGQAGALFSQLNPILMADSNEKADLYRVEPYVMCADIYSRPPYLGRGGWTWYSGSAAWMYRLGVEGLLGFKKAGNFLSIDPAIPPEWDGYEIEYKHGSAGYHIRVSNPNHVSGKVKSVTLDGVAQKNHKIRLVDDRKMHTVEIELGEVADQGN